MGFILLLVYILASITCAVTLLIVIGLYMRRKRRLNSGATLIRKEWIADVVYLVQFPPSPSIRTISPFSLKLESWFRLHNIKYENIYSLKFSAKGQIPYIEFKGRQYADSNLIMTFLTDHLKLQIKCDNPDNLLTVQQKCLSHSFLVMLENQTIITNFYSRYGFHMDQFYSKLIKDHFPPSVGTKFFFPYVMPLGIKMRVNMSSLGRHSYSEITNFANQDLKCISDYLSESGEKQFVFGDSLATLDCVLFAHLVQFIYIPIDLPHKQFINEHCQNLKLYVDRVRDVLWPDWEDMCNMKVICEP